MAEPSQKTTQKERDRIGLILYGLYAASLILGIIFIGRVIYIQNFWKMDDEVSKFFLPQGHKEPIYPERGAIIGCDGRILALSTPVYELFMDCTVQKAKFASEKSKAKADSLEKNWQAEAKAFAYALAAETGGSGADCTKAILNGRKEGKRYLKLATGIDRGTLIKLQKSTMMSKGQYKSGIIVNKKDTRHYPYGTLARRTIGYVKDNSNSNGNNHIGLEGKYDYVLHGKEGEIWLKTTDNRERIQDYDSTYVKPEDGLDVRTTLDITLQDIADRALRKQIEENTKIDMGCVILMDVKTGAIRAMVNLVRDSTSNTPVPRPTTWLSA
jgi:Cell division protein FtsI/penicillin-binding protein 2